MAQGAILDLDWVFFLLSLQLLLLNEHYTLGRCQADLSGKYRIHPKAKETFISLFFQPAFL